MIFQDYKDNFEPTCTRPHGDSNSLNQPSGPQHFLKEAPVDGFVLFKLRDRLAIFDSAIGFNFGHNVLLRSISDTFQTSTALDSIDYTSACRMVAT
jgi:hypothetical protein